MPKVIELSLMQLNHLFSDINEESDTRLQARSLWRKMEELECVLILPFCTRVLGHFHKVNNAIQKLVLLMSTCASLYTSLQNFANYWSRNCLPFRTTRVHPRFLVGFMLLDLQFYVYVLQIVVCPFLLFLFAIVLSVLLRYTDSDYPFGIFKLFLWKILMNLRNKE